MTYIQATSSDVKIGNYLYSRSGNTYRRWKVEPRIMVEDMIRAGLSPKQRPYLRDETMDEFNERIRVIKVMADRGGFFKKAAGNEVQDALRNKRK